MYKICFSCLFLLIVFAWICAGCASPARPGSPTPHPALPLPFSATPEGAYHGKIQGIYITARPAVVTQQGLECYNVLRFYEDGMVLMSEISYCPAPGQRLSLTEDDFAADMKRDSGRPFGEYSRLDNLLWFTVAVSTHTMVDFSGTFQDGRMVLTSYNHDTQQFMGPLEYVPVSSLK